MGHEIIVLTVLSNRSDMVLSGSKVVNFSIIVPTYNESANIIRLINEIEQFIPRIERTEIIVVDDNSPDGTGNLVENYIKKNERSKNRGISRNNEAEIVETKIRVIHRKEKNGLIPAIMEGVAESNGKHILIMDADFSHPPEVIPKMLEELRINPTSIIVA